MSDPPPDDRIAEASTEVREFAETIAVTSNYKVLGERSDSGGVGVLGHATATTGQSKGVLGVTDSADDATGVVGKAPQGEADGVIGVANNGGIGVGAVTDSPSQPGMLALNTAETGVAIAHDAKTYSADDGSAAVRGEATQGSGRTYGVRGTTASPEGYGLATPDDVRIQGLIDTAETDFVVEAGTTATSDAMNVIHGHASNRATSGVVGATIGGGGYDDRSIALPNVVSESYGTVAGGVANIASGGTTTVGGGLNNSASEDDATVSGGRGNTASARYASVGGGWSNTADGRRSTVGGGRDNAATATEAVVAGGSDNTASDRRATIGGGGNNTATSGSEHATVAGGISNAVEAANATVGGGIRNTASGPRGTVGGGLNNTAADYNATVAGGRNNTAGQGATTVAGGNSNTASATRSTVAGGISNATTGIKAFVGGGEGNDAGDYNAVVAGGFENTASGKATAVAGGAYNEASGRRAMIPGGAGNVAAGKYSFAAGRAAEANHDGTFVWSDSGSFTFSSTGTDQFLVDAPGGVGIGTDAPETQLDVDGAVSKSMVGLSAWLTANQAIDPSTNETVVFDGVNTDDFGGYDSSTGVYTVQKDGIYHVDFMIRWKDLVTGLIVSYMFEVNGSISDGIDVTMEEEGRPSRCYSKTIFGLARGDTLKVVVRHDSSDPKEVYGSSTRERTYLTIYRVG